MSVDLSYAIPIALAFIGLPIVGFVWLRVFLAIRKHERSVRTAP